MEVSDMNNHIKCKVCSCMYNKDECCEASHVEVSNCHCNDSTKSEQTECSTFKQK